MPSRLIRPFTILLPLLLLITTLPVPATPATNSVSLEVARTNTRLPPSATLPDNSAAEGGAGPETYSQIVHEDNSSYNGLGEALETGGSTGVSSKPAYLSSRLSESISVKPTSQQISTSEQISTADSQPTSSSVPVALNITTAIEGLNSEMLGAGDPPDVQVAAGPRHTVEMVNTIGEIWTKQGVPTSTFPLNRFFSAGSTDFISDPKILFDSQSGRWFASITDLTDDRVHIAVSQTDDPTGAWYHYTLSPASGYCADQPIIGVSDDKFVVSVNDFSNCRTQSFQGAQYWVLNKNEMVANLTTQDYTSGTVNSLFSVHPVQSLSPTTTQFMASVSPLGFIQLFSVTGTPPSVSIRTSNLPISRFATAPRAPQNGTSIAIDTADNRVEDAVWQKDRLWLAFDDGCIPSNDTQVRSCIRLTEIDTSSGTTIQSFDVSGRTGQYYFYPALRMDAEGNLIIVFGGSSATSYPSLLVNYQLITDSAGTWRVPKLLKEGSAATTSTRFGDYFGAGVDPSNPHIVWVAGEYVASDLLLWHTFIAGLALSRVEDAITFSYAVQGGGSGYTPPLLTYTFNGTRETALLTNTPTRFLVDDGTGWSIENLLSGSSSTERWQTNQTTTGIATSSLTMNVIYYHQYLVVFVYTFIGISLSNFTIPVANVTVTQFGQSAIQSPGVQLWVDSEGQWYATTPLQSSSVDRWSSFPTDGTITHSMTIPLTYYHQFALTLSYTLSGGGSPTPPILLLTQVGTNSTAPLSTTPSVFWADIDTTWSATNPVTSTGERWLAGASTGKATAPTMMILIYQHQFLLTVSGGSGGTEQTFWYNAGLVETANSLRVYDRARGTGERVESYNVDDSSSVPVNATDNNISVTVLINSPHTVRFNTVTQYQLYLDPQTTSALYKMTQPTINGDNYWYDAGQTVTIILNPIWGITTNTSRRNIASYTIDGNTTQVRRQAAGRISLPPIIMNTSHIVTVDSKTQYYITIQGASLSGSQTNDSWFDRGSPFTVETLYSRTYSADIPYRIYAVAPGLQILANTTVTAITWNSSRTELTFEAPSSTITIYIPAALSLTPVRVTDDGVRIEYDFSPETNLLTFAGSSVFQVSFQSGNITGPSIPVILLTATALATLSAGLVFLAIKRRRNQRVSKTPSEDVPKTSSPLETRRHSLQGFSSSEKLTRFTLS